MYLISTRLILSHCFNSWFSSAPSLHSSLQWYRNLFISNFCSSLIAPGFPPCFCCPTFPRSPKCFCLQQPLLFFIYQIAFHSLPPPQPASACNHSPSKVPLTFLSPPATYCCNFWAGKPEEVLWPGKLKLIFCIHAKAIFFFFSQCLCGPCCSYLSVPPSGWKL